MESAVREHPDVVERPWTPPPVFPDLWEEDEQRDEREREHGGVICAECGRRGPADSLCYPTLIQ